MTNAPAATIFTELRESGNIVVSPFANPNPLFELGKDSSSALKFTMWDLTHPYQKPFREFNALLEARNALAVLLALLSILCEGAPKTADVMHQRQRPGVRLKG